MNYIGSKLSLAPFLLHHIQESVQNKGMCLKDCVFVDAFAGSCAVGRLFKNRVKQVISNDCEFYSFVLAKNYIENTTPLKRAPKLLGQLQNLPPLKGKIYTHYALGGGHCRQYFSDENAMRIDAVRSQLARWIEQKHISPSEFYFLLASLLESSDKVANTACVYGAFLKTLKKSAQKPLLLSPAHFDLSPNPHYAHQQDAQELIKHTPADILYLDPPYNAREYGANYHLLNSIALYDDFTPQGKTGLRDYQKSLWCQKNSVAEALEAILKNAQAKFIFMSYNNEGLLSLDQIAQIFKQHGKYSLKSHPHTRFKANLNPQQRTKTTEYLHVLEKF
ncbi:DNA adenine methylase [Helicobacter bizzozeronii]|uniref:DNA adenine methylase n=1 Tax=Helicobacter bizzozeronii TaxID=56877 RepID=UPI000CEE6202|nr:DNA adenine methylase [Helicobacter bizzozeronii]